MEKEEKIVEEKKAVEIFKNIGIFFLILIGYLIVPQIVGLLFFKIFKLSETISMFIGNISFLILLLGIYYKMFKEKIKDYMNHFSNYFGESLKYWGIGLLVMFISNLILAYIVFSGDIAENEELNRIYIQASPIIGFISVVIIAPFIEEMIFRFGLRKMVGKHKYFPIISAIVFGVPHILAGITFPFGVNDLLQFLYVIPYGALGYAFGYIYNKTDNIFCSMTAHAIHNFMCFVVIILAV